MKNLGMWLWMLAVSCLLLPSAAMADSYVENAGGKLADGAANAAGALLEIPKNIKIASAEKGPLYGMTAGVVAGVLHTIGRTVYGVVDMATFMIPTSSMVDPVYAWTDFDRLTTYRAAVQMR
ncbi:MAG TPA: exosortase system-associated protein, TIGR04073 family [Nitrosospira sp.]|nr:exosortase system-associated protein, TIGR04073 family [Nitrosospira sp.]